MGITQVAIENSQPQSKTPARNHRNQIGACIEEIGIIPVIRAESAGDAIFAAETVLGAGIPVAEISMSVPGAIDVISRLVKAAPGVVIGAGNLLDAYTAQRCLDQGAGFLASDGLPLDIVELGAKENAVVIAGGLTPSEVIAAWKAGSDFVRVYPCDAVGGANYIRSLKAALPQARLIAAGGVTALTASELTQAGAAALAIEQELFPKEAVWLRQERRIQELARRFVILVSRGRRTNGAVLHGVQSGQPVPAQELA